MPLAISNHVPAVHNVNHSFDAQLNSMLAKQMGPKGNNMKGVRKDGRKDIKISNMPHSRRSQQHTVMSSKQQKK